MNFPTDHDMMLIFYPTECKKYGVDAVVDYSNALCNSGLTSAQQAEKMCLHFPLTDEEYAANEMQDYIDDVAYRLLYPDSVKEAEAMIARVLNNFFKKMETTLWIG